LKNFRHSKVKWHGAGKVEDSTVVSYSRILLSVTVQEQAMIVNRLRILLAEKATRERRYISLRDVSRETGVSNYTLAKLANNEIKEFPADVLERLCKYFGITPGELLFLEPEEQPGNKYSPALIAA